MPIAINHKICDNSSECPGIAVCKTGALYYDNKLEQLVVDNAKCVSCAQCVSECEIGAIRFAADSESFKSVLKEIDADPRNASDLFVDRYGAEPVIETFLIDSRNMSERLKDDGRVRVFEIFDCDVVECLLKSIPINEIFDLKDYEYYKMEMKVGDLEKKYGATRLPALLIFRGNEMMGKVEGYYPIDKKSELKKIIKGVLND